MVCFRPECKNFLSLTARFFPKAFPRPGSTLKIARFDFRKGKHLTRRHVHGSFGLFSHLSCNQHTDPQRSREPGSLGTAPVVRHGEGVKCWLPVVKKDAGASRSDSAYALRLADAPQQIPRDRRRIPKWPACEWRFLSHDPHIS